MISSNSISTAQWGKLTNLSPNFDNISLSKNPSDFTVLNGLLLQGCAEDIFSMENKCQIYWDKEDFFLCYTGRDLSVLTEDHTLKQNEAFKVHSGERIVFILQKPDEPTITMEYIFSGELIQTQRDILKEEHKKNEEIVKMKFDETLKNETRCLLCCKMIYECVSVVPCLHSFCMYCLVQHLKGSQECPQCGQGFTELRKNVFLNNIIEAYEESGYRRDRTQEECKEMGKLLGTESFFSKFEYANGDIYEGELRKCRREGRGKCDIKMEAFMKETGGTTRWKVKEN